ncbi:50S ribosomal protein L25 [Clostridium sp.]|jgi:large subunit ribosomal protein L25|uniref:50S ribosomal protein L25 n=1 Tax=Clostridium sp. TaxID=1506 RepID=UPI003EEE27DB
MNPTTLDAFERILTKKKFNEEGFIAGVIYGDKIKEPISVKIEVEPLIRILKKHGSNAKVWVKYGEEKKFGFVKEIQRHPVSANITHIDLQIVSLEHEVKLQLPITFKGEENLIDNLLELKVYKTEIDVFGTMAVMPDYVTVDVADKKFGDSVTIKDFVLDGKIKVTDEEDEVYAAVVAKKEQAEEVIDEPVVEA